MHDGVLVIICYDIGRRYEENIMASGSSSGGKGTKKYGKNVINCQRYKNADKRFKSKMKNILQSNGKHAAKKYETHVLNKGSASGIQFGSE